MAVEKPEGMRVTRNVRITRTKDAGLNQRDKLIAGGGVLFAALVIILVLMNPRKQLAPVVNVPAPVVNYTPPTVHVPAPVVNYTPPAQEAPVVQVDHGEFWKGMYERADIRAKSAESRIDRVSQTAETWKKLYQGKSE